MKILFINTFDEVGGAGLLAWNLGKILEEQGHDVKYIVGFKKSKNQNVYQLKKNYFLNLLAKHSKYDINFISRGLISKFLANDVDFGANKEILNHPWFKSADIIHCHNLHGNYFRLETLIQITKSKKTIWTIHDCWPIMAHGAWITGDNVKDGFYRRSCLNTYPAMLWNNEKHLTKVKTKTYLNSNIIITVPSLWMKNKVDSSILKDKETYLVHNGIDLNIFKRYNKIESRKKLNLPINKEIILFVADSGKNNQTKGWKYIEKVITYFKNDKNKLFICIGGSNLDKKNNNDQVIFINYIKDSSLLAQYYSASDIFLFASLIESFGLVAIEAISCGALLVGFPVGIVPELIEHQKNGYIAKHRSANDLINGINFIFHLDQNTKEKIIKANINLIHKNYSLDFMAEKYLNIYQKALNE